MAATLEAAAHDKNLSFINENLEEILTAFKGILEGIQLILPVKPSELEGKGSGDMDHLKKELDALHDASEFANINWKS